MSTKTTKKVEIGTLKPGEEFVHPVYGEGMVLAENGLTEQALEMAVPVVLYDPRSKGPEFDGFSSKTEVTIEGEWPTWEDLEQGTLFKFGGSGREFVRAGKGYLPAGTGDIVCTHNKEVPVEVVDGT